MRSTRTLGSIILLFVLFQSCDLTKLNQPGEAGHGTMSAVMNDTSYEFTSVSASEDVYNRYACGGYLRGTQFSLSLGPNPKTGDTLILLPGIGSDAPVYAKYQNHDALLDTGFILIASKSGQNIKGTFQCNVVIAPDTFRFRNGSFDCYFAGDD